MPEPTTTTVRIQREFVDSTPPDYLYTVWVDDNQVKESWTGKEGAKAAMDAANELCRIHEDAGIEVTRDLSAASPACSRVLAHCYLTPLDGSGRKIQIRHFPAMDRPNVQAIQLRHGMPESDPHWFHTLGAALGYAAALGFTDFIPLERRAERRS